MINSASIYTYELDDAQAALEELCTQLDQKLVLLPHTVGILMCDPEFMETGVYEAVCAGLPFPVAGTTTMTQAVNGTAGLLLMTIMVLTSDDVFFEVGMSEPIGPGGDILAATRGAYQVAADALPDKVKFTFLFPPLIRENAGDQYIDAFEVLCPDTPVFGTLAVDDSSAFENSFTFCNGKSSKESMAFILTTGNISPRFAIATVSDKKALPYTGEITKSEGHIVHEIDGMPAVKYFESIGFAQNGVLNMQHRFVPFVLDFKKLSDYDGVPVVRAMVYINKSGAGVCRGYMYQNSVFTLTTPGSDDVYETSKALVEDLRRMPDKQAVILFSCLVRRMPFGAQPLTEANMILENTDPDMPFMLAYSGGEICPTSVREGAVTNRFHNYSLIACVL